MIQMKNLILLESEESKDGKYGSTSLSVNSAIDIINNNCKSWMQNIDEYDSRIYRGIELIPDTILVSDPKLVKRDSVGLKRNYYMMHLDNSKNWEKFPKRSNSLICTTSQAEAAFWGRVFNVIPFDGAKFAVINQSDIWNLSYKILPTSSLKSITDIFKYIEDTYYNKKVNTYSELLKFYKFIEKNYKSFKMYDINMERMFKEYEKYNTSFFEFMEIVYHPKNVNTKLIRYNNNYKHGKERNEMWTNSKCILVDNIFYNKFTGYVKKYKV